MRTEHPLGLRSACNAGLGSALWGSVHRLRAEVIKQSASFSLGFLVEI